MADAARVSEAEELYRKLGERLGKCRHCEGGHKPRWRADSEEWVHSYAPTASNGGRFSITVCLSPP